MKLERKDIEEVSMLGDLQDLFGLVSRSIETAYDTTRARARDDIRFDAKLCQCLEYAEMCYASCAAA